MKQLIAYKLNEIELKIKKQLLSLILMKNFIYEVLEIETNSYSL